MKKTILRLALFLFIINSSTVFAQTTAMDFEGVDCNDNPVHLFQDLEDGKYVVLFYYMANCGSCPPKAQTIQTMANAINATNPGLVKGYAFPYTNNTTCSYSASWVDQNNLPLYAPMDSGTVQVAYYGGFGMPTVVLLGGINHDVLFVTQDFSNSDTTTMHNLILQESGLNSIEKSVFNHSLLFPNPASDEITLKFDQAVSKNLEIKIITLDGKEIKLFNSEEFIFDKNSIKLPISMIDNGSYLLQIINGDNSTIEILNIKR